MPIYEYECRACGAETEELQGINEAPLTTCESCNKKKLVKKVSAAGFRLSGSGWYETDFKQDKQKNLAGDAKKAKSSDGESSKVSNKKADKAKPAKKDATPAKPASKKD